MASSPKPESDKPEKICKFPGVVEGLRGLVPQLEKQATTLHADIGGRPERYVGDILRSGAVRFAAGNATFAAFLGQVAGLDVGPGGAVAIQTAVAVHTAVLQVASTYNGSSPAATYRMQATANFLTASLLAGNAAKDIASGDPHSASMMALPIATFSAWGKGHWDLANFLDRLTELKAQDKPADEIKKDLDNDPLLKKFERKYIRAYGAADLVAPWKSMPIQEVANTFGTLFTNPTFLAHAQVSSLVTMPFFLAGVSKDRLAEKLPCLKKLRGFNNTKPEALYAGGYSAGAILSLLHGDYLFSGTQALWALGYDSIANKDKAPDPISADDYKKIKAFMEDPKAIFEVFAESMNDLKHDDAVKAWDAVSEQMLQLYRLMPKKAVDKKAEAFAMLELLAEEAPKGANVALKAITDLAKQGDSVALGKMERMSAMIEADPDAVGPNPRRPHINRAREIVYKRSGRNPDGSDRTPDTDGVTPTV